MFEWLKKKNNFVVGKNVELKKEFIDVKSENGLIVVDIKEDCALIDYNEASNKSVTLKQLEQGRKIANDTLFDHSFNWIKRKKIYIFDKDNYSYNIYSNVDTIYINERIKSQEDGHVDERKVEINRTTGQILISDKKHDKYWSTYYMKFFDSNKTKSTTFPLDKDDAFEIAHQIIVNLRCIENIDKVINLEEVDNYLKEYELANLANANKNKSLIKIH